MRWVRDRVRSYLTDISLKSDERGLVAARDALFDTLLVAIGSPRG